MLLTHVSLFWRAFILLIFCLFFSAYCVEFLDAFQYWAEEDKAEKRLRIEEQDLQKWMRHLKLNRDRALELEEQVQKIVNNDRLQGELSRKIAQAHMKKGHYDLASLYYEGALQSKLPSRKEPEKFQFFSFETSIAHYDTVLLFQNLNPDIFYEAGIAYANASRAQAWEKQRFERALLLFQRMSRLYPEDLRPLYQMALLYGKTSLKKYKNTDYAISLLRKFLTRKTDDWRARFALAHFLAEKRNWEEAILEYKKIETLLSDWHEKKLIPGDISKNSMYKQARENREKLEKCMQSSAPCLFSE